MANNDQVAQEYLLIKCFLYKYTPPFSKVSLPAEEAAKFALSTFKPYSVELNNTKYFTKYDISQFVTDYSFEQNIDDTTYSWSVSLQDLALSYSTVNNKLKVTPPTGNTLRGGLSFSSANSSDSLGLISEYEANANTFDNNDSASDDSANPILNAKFERGKTPAPLTVQNTNLNAVLSTIQGLRLSDLIQEYDFISLFLYKNSTPLTDIFGQVVPDGFSPQNDRLYVFNYAFTDSDQIPFGTAFNKSNFQTLNDANLQHESILLTKMPNGRTLFSNEFNGFVMKKTVASSINQVDRVVVSGNGWSRLFGATRRALKTSLFANALYQAGQVTGLDDITPYENIFAGQPISEIIQGLFDSVYKIDFNTTTIEAVQVAAQPINPLNSTNLATCPLNQDNFFASPLGLTTTSSNFTTGTTNPPLGTSFYNTTSLIVANGYPANLFSVPPYLLASVMRLRPFAYIEPLDMSVTGLTAFVTNAKAAANASVPSGDKVPPDTFQHVMQNYSVSQQVINYTSTSPVFIDPTVQNLRAYFRFLDAVFLPFSPQLQTPYEILDQIRSVAFVEIYEQPGGQFIVRSPQYNNMADSISGRSDISLIHSSNLNIISTNYTTSVEHLVSKILTGYSPDFTPIGLLQQFGYCDGKLLIQNGQLEMDTAANPNATTSSLSNDATNNSKTTGIFGWAEYLMELANAKLKTGSIICDLDTSIQVGNTFIDETKFKFGYIVGVTKHVSVTGTATMNLSLSYVRDAVPQYQLDQNGIKQIKNINTDLLPVLTNIENSFATGS